MAIQLRTNDFDQLVKILSTHAEWHTVRGRMDLLTDVFAGSPREADIRGQLELEGTPHGTASRVVDRLTKFGQDELGRETVGLLVSRLLVRLGRGSDADFLQNLLIQYPLDTRPAAARRVQEWRGGETDSSVGEKIIGENTLRDIFVFEVLLVRAQAVVRVRTPTGIGTGFLLSDDMIMTNNHVVGTPELAKRCTVDFNYQVGVDGRALLAHSARARPDVLFYTSPMAPYNALPGELDYTIMQLDEVPAGITPLRLASTSIVRDSRLIIVQHPGGGYKKVSLQNNFVEYVDDNVVQYTTSTEAGSSGSPVMTEDFVVAAIHHAATNTTA